MDSSISIQQGSPRSPRDVFAERRLAVGFADGFTAEAYDTESDRQRGKSTVLEVLAQFHDQVRCEPR